MKSKTLIVLAALAMLLNGKAACAENSGARRLISLDGTWQIAQGGMDSVPNSFEHTVPVPGLVDMAKPPFAEVGRKSEKRQAFWYRCTFNVEGPVPDVAVLKIHKAKYGTKVFLNGWLVGEHLPCFTPALFDVKKYLKCSGDKNELVIRLGANRESLPEGMPTGWDFEKYLYIPGIFDSVELILTGAPYIVNVQTVPDISAKKVRVVAEVESSDKTCDVSLICRVTEAASGIKVGSGRAPKATLEKNQRKTLEVSIPIENCRLWSPEEPFLYQLELTTGADTWRGRFGMRSFRFDKETGRALLNGKPYIMRGTNVCVYRFFEDSQRADRPWRKEWVRRLHQKFKTMHWNSIRYCIGFPPEIWYQIADEEGFLIQDEFPIWLLDRVPEKLQSEKIIPEYTEWMRERWNHPCVVIWDAQNESATGETGKAIQAVRHLDLSNRPWENGWAEPQSTSDCVESHPYPFIKVWMGEEPFQFSEIANYSSVPYLQEPQKKYNLPIIINEYGWLWLNRDGTPTTLTKKVYENFFPDGSTTEQRRLRYVRYLAALTEFWRCHRKAAAVLHFCGLGYSRPNVMPTPQGGATSDHFTDLEKLTFEPYFEEYLRDAFSPVGMMINFWGQQLTAGENRKFEVFVINDYDRQQRRNVRFRIMLGDKTIAEQLRDCTVAPLGREILTFEMQVPEKPGQYLLVAEFVEKDGNVIRSLRDFEIAPQPE